MARGFHRRKQDEETNYWLSYSDMMAGLLLTFVLIISLTMLRARMQYDEKQTELIGMEEELLVQRSALEDEQAKVIAQAALLDTQQQTLDDQQAALIAQQDKLLEQEETLRQQHLLLSELQEIMNTQQARLDRIIGVRSELIEALKEEFEGSNTSISVDERTGAITFDSSILFEYNEATLKDTGKEFLAEFLPSYVRILLGPKYSQYVSEIMIEGHTDTSGGYLYNLDLSQKRAFSVAEYCLSDDNDFLTKSDLDKLRGVVSATGRSYSSPVYKADGRTIDDDASRRVEIQFRLKDEEMIREMIEILSSDEDQPAQGQTGRGQ